MKIDTSSLYRQIIKKSFLITWQNKFLWIFGFFTAFLGLGSMYNIILKNDNEIFYRLTNRFTSISLSGIIISENIEKINITNLILLFVAVVSTIAAILFLTWLAIRSLGALIKAGQLLDNKKDTTFKKSFDKSRGHFWPLLLLNIVGKLLIFLFLAVIAGLVSTVVVNNSIGQALLYFCASLVLVSLSLLVSFLIIYASCFIVLKSKKMFESIHKAWTLFKQNWIISIEAAAILFFINLLVKLSLVIILILLSIPFMVLLLIFYSASFASMPSLIMAIWLFISILVMIFAGSLFSTFQIVAWTLLFDKIDKGGVLSKLHRIFG